jgi:hypothetical protein
MKTVRQFIAELMAVAPMEAEIKFVDSDGIQLEPSVSGDEEECIVEVGS